MKELFIEVESFDVGGLEKVVLDLSLLFKRDGIKTVVVTPGDIGSLGERARSEGIEVLSIKGWFPQLKYLKLLISRRPEATISHFTYFGYLPSFLARVPNITYIHNVYAFFSAKQARRFSLAKYFVSGFIAVSSIAKEYAVSTLGLKAEKVQIVPNGLTRTPEKHQPQRTAVSRSTYGLTDDDFVFICPANLNLHKGFFLLLESLSLAIQHNPKIKVICLGGIVFPPHYDLIESEITRLKLGENVFLLGHKSDMKSHYGLADAAILVSFIEGWSIAVNECMAHQLPLILSETGSARELIEDGDCGFLISQPFGAIDNLNPRVLNNLAYTPQKYNTSVEVAQAMIQMSSNKNRAKEMGLAGQKKIYEFFNEDLWFNRTRRAYERILTNGLSD